ncbi:DNA mismatch repair protein MutS [bacterium]|nr:DNA mismatch repair protein MutS [bacterium]
MATPMIKQYNEIKSKHADCILFFRLGDFYEMFGEDAIKASKLLNITLTARNKGDGKVPMCGVPHHAAENYIAKLTKFGEKVAICDQVSDPNLPGIVEREVTKIITPGTTFNDNVLDMKTNNFVMSVIKGKRGFGLSYADLTTGEFAATQILDFMELLTEISKISPAECILSPEFYESEEGNQLKNHFESVCFFPFESFRDAKNLLINHFNVNSLHGFGIEEYPLAIKSSGVLLNYLQETQKTKLPHLHTIRYLSTSKYMPIDESTLRNLELLRTLRYQEKEGSLISVIDKSNTPMGARMLRFWLTHPLLDKNEIEDRLSGVEKFLENHILQQSIEELLKNITDIERLISKLSVGTGNARDLLALKESLKYLPEFKKVLSTVNSNILKKTHDSFIDMSALVEIIESSIDPEAKLPIKDGNIIKSGYNKELDELKSISREGKTFIKNLQKKEIERTGISSMKVKYNKVFGYFIEISKTNLKLVPDNYIRKQTLVNAERFITPELKEYEEKILGAEEKIIKLEYELFQKIRDKTVSYITDILHNAKLIAILDVLVSFASVAKYNNYSRPEITQTNGIKIVAGRHPVIEQMTFASSFIPNDITLDNVDNRLLLITGPNMGGKSTILRQTALIVLLAHIGSFVPAESASIQLVDRIFTRVGASDNLIKGQSTFMVEMQEAAFILNNATHKSLIILDEIGRGTSTYDGVSIAWAITEYIHNHVKAKTLFATHYHELISVVDNLPHAQNYSVAVKEKSDGVIFLYKLQKKSIDKSYGIEVAKRAGLPNEIIEKSSQILSDLEEEVVEKGIQRRLDDPKKKRSEDQMDLFGNSALLEEFERKTKGLKLLKEKLDNLDIDKLTPLEALNKLNELKKK